LGIDHRHLRNIASLTACTASVIASLVQLMAAAKEKEKKPINY